MSLVSFEDGRTARDHRDSVIEMVSAAVEGEDLIYLSFMLNACFLFTFLIHSLVFPIG